MNNVKTPLERFYANYFMHVRLLEFINKYTNRYKVILPFTIAIVTYLIFFGTVIFSKDTVFWGSDIRHKFYPVRVYLYKTITEEHRFPFWTEKIYSGFPIYADSENAYLNPINIFATVIFGPTVAYKILHLLMYLAGSYGLYLFLKNKGIGLLGYSATNVIFYFSFFFINHQIHQSLIFTMYTFPLSLYLIDKYLLSHQKRFAIFNIFVITNAFYWGHPQMFLIYLLGLLVYVFVYHLNKQALKHLLILGWFITVLSLPQLIPSVVLNAKSYRSADSEQINANQGAFHPLMATSLIFPSIFSNDANFQGEKVDPNYSYVETYGYLGISVFIVLILAFLFTTDKKLIKFIFLTSIIYFVLSYGKFIPILKLDETPVIDLFRYWNRSLVLLSFSIALFVGNFLDALYKQILTTKIKEYKNVLYYFVPILIISALNLGGSFTANLTKTIQQSVTKSYDLKEWLLIVGLSITCGIVIIKIRKIYKLAAVFLLILIFIDLRYFSNNLINMRTDTITHIEHVDVPNIYDSKRIIIEKGEIVNNESLYYNFWWPFGYSQFKDKDYYEYFSAKGITNITQPKAEDLTKEFYAIYQGIGVTNIIFDRSNIVLNTNNLDLLQNDIPGQYLIKNEGHLKFEIDAKQSGNLDTFIKAYPGWRVTLNNAPVKPLSSLLFLSIPIEKGSSIIDIQYIPIHFNAGVIICVIGLILSLFTYTKVRHI